MTTQYIWDIIANTVANPTSNLVYFGIGSTMKYYDQITPSNNQQCPCFLDKFEGNKVIVLFDPCLEAPLKIETYFEEKSDRLIMTNSSLDANGTCFFREFRNSSGSVKVFAINDYFNFEHTNYYEGEKKKKYNDNVDITVSNMINLIGICLGKRDKTKLLLQDYSGRPVMRFYSSFLKSFDRDEMLSNIMFDVTQRDPGCYFEITPEYPTLTEHGDLIQESFMELVKIRGCPLYTHCVKKRIDQLIYPLTSNYVKLTQDPSFEPADMDKIYNLCTIYLIDFNETIGKDQVFAHRDYLLAKFMELIQIMLKDIVRSLDCDVQYIDHFIQLMFNRNEFISSLSVLKSFD